MATDKPAVNDNAPRIVRIAGITVGFFVFLAGISMILLVFSWGYGLFQGIDTEVLSVSHVLELSAPATTVGPANASADTAADVVAATPGGPGLLAVGAIFVLKLIALLVLGWLGAMVASKGAEMTGIGGSSQGK